MAVLAAPLLYTTPNHPQSAAELTQPLNVPGVIVYTGGVLPAPVSSSLASDPAAGYATSG